VPRVLMMVMVRARGMRLGVAIADSPATETKGGLHREVPRGRVHTAGNVVQAAARWSVAATGRRSSLTHHEEDGKGRSSVALVELLSTRTC
jgi:hypothetical protein